MIKKLKSMISGQYLDRLTWKCIGISQNRKKNGRLWRIIGNLIFSFILGDLEKCLNYKGIKQLSLWNKNEYDELKTQIKSLPAKEVSNIRWQILSNYYTFKGLYSLAYICRQKSKENLYNSNSTSLKKILALIEDSRIEDAQRNLEQYKKRLLTGKLMHSEIELIDNYLRVLNKRKHNYDADKNFEDYVKAKKVAIVGPTISMEEMIRMDIKKKYDLIIRNNSQVHQNQNPRIIDITYCNGEFWQLMKKEGILGEYDKSFDWICLKSGMDIREDRKDNFHIAPAADNLLYMGTANMLPIMIIDLLFYNIDCIFVCGNNLFLTKNAHARDYVSREKETQVQIKRKFTIHNLLSQHLILKSLYERGLFIADEELQRVLNLSTMDYALEMERIHG